MPDENKDNNNGGAPADDKNKNGGDGGNNGGGSGNGPADDVVTIKKSDLKKIEEDRDNYRDGLLAEKTKNKNLPGNDGGNNGGGNSPAALDEKKVEEIATNAVHQVSKKTAEKNAKARFFKTNPEYLDDKVWQELLPHVAISKDDNDEDAIMSRLEDAVLVHKRRTGKLDEYLEQQRQNAQRQAEIDAQVNMGRNGGGVGGKANQGGGPKVVPESTAEMGRHFGHSSEHLEESIKNTPKGEEGGFVLDITKPKPKKK